MASAKAIILFTFFKMGPSSYHRLKKLPTPILFDDFTIFLIRTTPITVSMMGAKRNLLSLEAAVRHNFSSHLARPANVNDLFQGQARQGQGVLNVSRFRI
jgi:hypothetical protein